MTHLIWQRPDWPAFSWKNLDLMDLLVRVRFRHGKLVAFAPLLSSYRGDLLLIDHIDGPLNQAALVVLFGELRKTQISALSVPAGILQTELKKFLNWWNEAPVELDGVLRSGIALVWILILQPFEENNEEIARELCELALAQDAKTSTRLFDFPIQEFLKSEEFKKSYRDFVEGRADLTSFLDLYLNLLLRSFDSAVTPTDEVISSFRFWRRQKQSSLNERQKKLLDHLLRSETKEISNRDYVSLFKVSRESAKRDLVELERLKFLKRNKGRGRSVSYHLTDEFQ